MNKPIPGTLPWYQKHREDVERAIEEERREQEESLKEAKERKPSHKEGPEEKDEENS